MGSYSNFRAKWGAESVRKITLHWYTDYFAEEVLGEVDGRAVYPDLAVVKRCFVQSVGSCLPSLLPRRVHTVTLTGFLLKLICFVFAHSLNLWYKAAG
jgi:hypothetical protein